MVGLRFLTDVLLFTTVLAAPATAPYASDAAKADDFNPYQYTKKFADCAAVERDGPSPKSIKLKLAYLDINPTAKKTLVLVHGWPSLWTTYRNQITYFKRNYRLIIPEHRGYGDSQHPLGLNASNAMYDFVGDITCMMDKAGVKSGVCVGNDFGAQVCWEAGRSRPDRFIGVFNVGIPYISADVGFSTNAALAQLNPSFSYQVFLGSNPTGAARELNADIRSAIRSCAQMGNSTTPKDFLQRNDTFLGPWREFEKTNNLKEIPFSGIMSRQVEDYMVASYQKQGFYTTFNGYQYGNRKLTFDFEKAQGNSSLPQPTFTLFPTKDPVADWQGLADQVKSSAFLKNYRTATIPTAHWPHEEAPDQFNLILSQWLGNVTFS
ncbi:alpha/beta-hydrolase [Trichodelitschia bisporula]|uniref:Alpha/beta-hydrolase n=1 Tax=Trichodelitschia bisporula TaxID=703511 RepID=A0A6G1HW60_9PEZI|nr:alpha/beta-hydrolase [Trichodelitschia bisporula]